MIGRGLARAAMVGLAAAPCLLACTKSDPAASYAPPPASSVVEPGARPIRREIFVVPGVVPPPNPQGAAATPPEQNRVRVVRYRVDAIPPRPARAVFVLMPGFLAGAGSFDGLARAIVRRSTDAEAFEAWAIDRRSNLLEDTHGLDVAEVNQSSRAAYSYYIDGEPVEGKTFAGFTSGPEAPWASEWGLATTVGDLRKVIELVAPEERKRRVVLLGHSLGASIVEAYAAWDFGTPGHDDLAALVLADGVAGNEGAPPGSVSQAAYEDGDPKAPGFPSPGVVKDIRGGNTFTTVPLLGVQALAVAEAVAIDARFHPADVQVDVAGRDSLLGVALGLTTLPRLTNRAAFGLAFDEGSAPLSFAAARCGAAKGGALGSYNGPFGGSLVHPTEPSATYDWVDGPETGEPTRLADLATAWFLGPGVNFAEWYFPQRLPVDAAAAGTLVVAEDDWRSAVYGLRARHGAAIDLPIFGAAFHLVGTASAFDKLRALVAPIGAARPLAGRPRTDADAFLTKEYRDLAHIDGLVGADLPGGAAAVFYDDLVAFAKKQTADGGVVIPVVR
jgi:hypothetical protein